MKLNFESGDCYIELDDEVKAVIRKMDESWIRIMMGSTYCQGNRLQVAVWEKKDGKYEIIEERRIVTISQVRRILSVI